MTNSSKQKSEVELYNELMKDFRIAERQKIMGRFKKTLWFIAILLFLLFALKYYYPRQPKYVTYQTTKGMPEADIVEVFRKSYDEIKGEYVQQMLEKNPEKIKKMRIKNMGKFHGLEIKESESMYWPLLENAHIESLDLYGAHIEPEAWKWLQTIKNFDNDLNIQLTNQKLDDAFYDGLNKFFEEKKVDRVTIQVADLDVCRLKFLSQINGIQIMKAGVNEPQSIAHKRIRSLHETADDINKEVMRHGHASYQSYHSEKVAKSTKQPTITSLIVSRCN